MSPSEESGTSSQEGCACLARILFNLFLTLEFSVDFDENIKTTNHPNEWDYLGDGYFTLEERAELCDLVRNEKLEMLEVDLDPAALGMLD